LIATVEAGLAPKPRRMGNSRTETEFLNSKEFGVCPRISATIPAMEAKDREPLFQSLFESSPDAIFIEDMVGNVLDCNPAAAALHGTSRKNIIGKNVSELVPPNRRSEVRTLSTGTPVEFEGWSLAAGGKSIPVSIRTSRIVYLGQPAMLLNVRDIAERKKF